ncbi:di-heme oxidoredictase family protein [Paraglaciecola sp. 2405UD69-4]|uniref:di-heme oxidoredictase family protein n=1 Tax=Paraglaciecola sp. 2405UD69-4 TaxID=3391836 RepID=UPI0039C8F146
MSISLNSSLPNQAKIFGSLFISIALTACGGGGGASNSNDTPIVIIEEPEEPELDHSGLTPVESDIIDNTEYLAGGDVTLFVTNDKAFETRPDAIADDFTFDSFFTQGDHLFRTAHDDSGPLMNSDTCQSCHINDGRGEISDDIDTPFISTLIKISDSAGNEDPIYGDQIQIFAEQSFSTSDLSAGIAQYDASINGDQLFGEAYVFVEYQDINGTYPDGTAFTLRNPVYKIKSPSFGPFTEDIQFSVRMAPSVFGTGLLDAIPADNILALADESDSDNDGISGRASMVTDAISGETVLGRFAYKAQAATVLQQSAAAYRGDIGLTNSLATAENCTDLQLACQVLAEQEGEVGDDYDVSDRELALVEFYTSVLGVPARRGYDSNSQTWDADISEGRRLFFESGCIGCHTPRHVTADANGSALGDIPLIGDPDPTDAADIIEPLSNQTIYPYTDLLLHDLGGSCAVTRELADGTSCTEGEACYYVQRCEGLADGVAQGDAIGSEWKTPALWGLGLVQTVNSDSTFLHDGRARTIEEAILWHGGEAEAAKSNFMELDASARTQMLQFLSSL